MAPRQEITQLVPDAQSAPHSIPRILPRIKPLRTCMENNQTRYSKRILQKQEKIQESSKTSHKKKEANKNVPIF